ncbi:unnamed protein product [Didymodactylos carnosus]|uniref:Charged multivesicular body protein 5 n=1 Tax=Didymodactylos carnosus TaxID=1234261 RepID=A0A815CQ73_9BILA|nr:unnamed protein product [Didymodactylos carnosus]CAF1290323.1 unnamed protein product [Didymodactylos carnosus]CAF3610248.1 unnamed protein product [Didymodactylos carnosus]CAF4095454.1 unnamed protein product [Didymodactylos carnosus]
MTEISGKQTAGLHLFYIKHYSKHPQTLGNESTMNLICMVICDFMNRLFGAGKATTQKPTLNDTAANLDSRVGTINKKIAELDVELAAYGRLPPGQKAAKKARALRLLQQKKMLEGQRNQIEGQSANIGQTAFALSNIETNKQIFNGMKDANKQLKKGFKDFNINKVERTMDDLDDSMFDYNEINEALSRPLNDQYVDESELDAELFAIANEELGMDSGAMVTGFSAPSVPVQPIDTGRVTNKNGVEVDEFGLPKVSAGGMKY